jgi:glycosyltransferase involved in cell wall biosynthesis
MTQYSGNLLCVANFPSNTGYAWDFICSLYARAANHLVQHGVRTFVAYPSMPVPPRALEGSAAEGIVLDATLASSRSVRETAEFIRRERVRVVYFTDRHVRNWRFLHLRRVGVRKIVVHDHVSGEQTRPRGFKRLAKWVLARTPGIMADDVIAVSHYVARRQREVGLVPMGRVTTIWNGIPLPELHGRNATAARQAIQIPADRFLIACACRAAREKGVHHLLRAFDQVARATEEARRRPVLLFIGDGPLLPELRQLRDSLETRNEIFLAGYRPDARVLLESADICVVPSIWQDALPLAVMEAMALAKPLIATRVGGIPEMIEDQTHGLLVPPGNESALAAAIRQLMTDKALARRLGEAARARVGERFTPQRQIRRILAILEEGWGGPCEEVRE